MGGAQCSLQTAVSEGAMGGTQLSRTAKDALDKATKTAELAVKKAKLLTVEGAGSIQAASLAVRSQTFQLQNKPDEALNDADEAILLFRESGEYHNEGLALILAADALKATRQYDESNKAVAEALKLMKEYGDEANEAVAEEIQAAVQQVLAQIQAQRMAQMAPQQQQYQPMQMMPLQQQQQYDAGPADAGTSVARPTGPRGPALDLSGGVSEEMVKSKVLEIA